MEKIYNVLLDTKDDVKNPAFVVNTNDLKTVKINLLINQDGDPLDLTGATVRLAVKKPDKTTVLQDITVVDALSGSCEIVLNTQAYVIDGKYDAEVMVYYGVDTVAVTGQFSYRAVKGILDDGSVESTNEWQSITQTLSDVQATVDDLRVNGTGIDAQARAGITSQAAQLAESTKYEEQFVKSLGFIKQDGSVVVIGDSITEGFGLTYSQHYISKLFSILKNANQYLNDFEVNTNFSADQTIQLSGSYSIGSKGASKKSLIMQSGATITFTGNVQYIDVIYDKTPTSGSIEVYKDGVLYKTISCSGSANPYAHSFPSASSNYEQSATYMLKCINAQVELLGLIRLQEKPTRGGINLIRCGVSSQSTSYFSDSTTLNYIKHATDYSIANQNKLYILAIGTNDIYNPSVANQPLVYQQNLETMIKSLLNDNNDVRIVLTVPPIANPSLWSTILASHSLYRMLLYQLADKYSLSVIDYSYLYFTENNWYQDGVHPNDLGTSEMVKHIQKTLSPSIKKTGKNDVSITLNNGYTNVGGEYGLIKGTHKNGRVILSGTMNVGTKTAGTIIASVQSGYTPTQSIPKNSVAFDSSGNPYNALIKIDSLGNITLVSDLNPAVAYIGLDGIAYDI